MNDGKSIKLCLVDGTPGGFTTVEISAAPTPERRSATLTQHSAFTSPSAAASVVLCQSANGRDKWVVTGEGVTYGLWQSRGVEESREGMAA